MDLKETEILGDDAARHWYYRSKASATERLIRDLRFSTILDVGAGSGFFSKHLLDRSAASDAWCVDISYPADHDALEEGKPIRFRRSIEHVDAQMVLLMDVLEHVDDDVGLLCEYVDKVPSGAHFLISVPAFQFLWSGHDDFLDHRRRYTLPQIESVARRAGLLLERSSYYFGAVFPLAAALRLTGRRKDRVPESQLRRHSPIVNALLSGICSAELPLVGFNKLAGLTAFSLARKP